MQISNSIESRIPEGRKGEVGGIRELGRAGLKPRHVKRGRKRKGASADE